MTEPDWQTRVHLLLRHPEEKLLWLDGDGLPTVDLPGQVHVAQVATIVEAASAALDSPLWLLRHVRRETDEPARRVHALYEVLSLDPGGLPADGWRPIPPLDDESWVHEAFGGRLRAGLRDVVLEAAPPLRSPWARPTWRDDLLPWLHERTAERDLTLRAVEQIKQWGVSSVLRLRTDGGDLWFKAPNPAMPLFANEATVTAALGRLFPDHIAAPLAVDEARDWMLLAPFDETPAPSATDEDRTALFGRFADLQINTIERVDELLAAGCLDRRPGVLATQIDPLLDDVRALAPLEHDERSKLRAAARRLEELCHRLVDGPLPSTLVHGDLHAGNTALADGRVVYFDWTDACVAHSFFDLQGLAWVDDPVRRDAFLAAYLAPWIAAYGESPVSQARHLTDVLRPLHHAVSYQQIVAHLEVDAKDELDDTHIFLRQLLRQLEVTEL